MYLPETAYKLCFSDLTITDTINAGTNHEVELQPSPGYVYEVIAVFINAPAIGGATGSHYVLVGYKDGSSVRRPRFEIAGTDGANFYIYTSGFIGDTEQPSGVDPQNDIMNAGRLYASYTIPLYINYQNSSDTNQTGDITIQFFYKKYREAL